MLQRIAFVLALGVTACGGKPTTTTTTPTTDGKHAPITLADPASEAIGGLSLGDPAAKVVEILGEPSTKGEVEEWAATGDRISSWTWPDKGVKLDMGEMQDQSFVVHSIWVEAPSTLTTSRGIGIGATFEAVDATYKEFRGVGRQEGEPEQWDLESGITVGSIYGGTMFNFKDGKVATIFVGAGAE
jgi:hypothetical protein